MASYLRLETNPDRLREESLFSSYRGTREKVVHRLSAFDIYPENPAVWQRLTKLQIIVDHLSLAIFSVAAGAALAYLSVSGMQLAVARGDIFTGIGSFMGCGAAFFLLTAIPMHLLGGIERDIEKLERVANSPKEPLLNPHMKEWELRELADQSDNRIKAFDLACKIGGLIIAGLLVFSGVKGLECALTGNHGILKQIFLIAIPSTVAALQGILLIISLFSNRDRETEIERRNLARKKVRELDMRQEEVQRRCQKNLVAIRKLELDRAYERFLNASQVEAEALLNREPDLVSYRDDEGRTLLMKCALRGDLEKVRLLKQNRAALGVRDDQGKTAFDLVIVEQGLAKELKQKMLFELHFVPV